MKLLLTIAGVTFLRRPSASTHGFLAAIFIVCCAATTPAQQTDEDATLSAMFSHGLVHAAIDYAAKQRLLAQDQPELDARWAMRLMECYAQAALRDLDNATSAWNQCEQIRLEFMERYPDHRRLPWLTWQLGRCRLLRAQSQVARFLAVPADSGARESALTEIRSVLELMEELQDDIRQRQPIASRQGIQGASQAPARQLAKLQVDAGLLSCEALLIRARLYPTGSPDRIAAATDAQARANSILSRTAEEWDTRNALRTGEAAAMLELGRAEEGLSTLAEIARTGGPTAAQAATLAIEYLSEIGQPSRAQGFLPALNESTNPARYALAKLQIQLSELKPEGQPGSREEQLQAVLDQARNIGQEFGPYWRNRAEALLVSRASTASAAGSTTAALELLKIEVRQLLAANDAPAAIEKLLEFRDNQAASANAEAALTASLDASALLANQKQWTAAAKVISEVAERFPAMATAAQGHARSVFLSAQALRDKPDDASLRQAYENAMRRQLELWPDAEESTTVQAWLRQWLLGQQRMDEYTQIVLERFFASQQKQRAQGVLIDWLANFLVMLSDSQQASAMQQLEALASSAPEPSNFVQSVQLVATAFAGWPDRSHASELASALNRLNSSATDSLDRQLLTAVELLRLTRTEQLSDMRRKAQDWNPQQLPMELRLALVPAMVEAIDELRQTSPNSWTELWKISPELLSALATHPSTELRAAGLRLRAWQGDSQAINGLQSLADANPQSAPLQLQLARALASLPGSDAEQRLAEASSRLRRLIASTPSGSDVDLAARWAWMKVLIAQGKQSEAERAARLLLASQPMESEVWQARFGSLAN
ncbi:MAG: hypothetical protein NXI32_09750 [bacterium]|nr:hypothetical protein [bacterium]